MLTVWAPLRRLRRRGRLRVWRGLDLGVVKVLLLAAAPRVRCPEHGVVVAEVPWARPRSRFTRWFEEQAAWLAAHTDSSTVAGLARTTWRTVVGIVGRVTAELAGKTDRLAGLHRIGIDEVAYRKEPQLASVNVPQLELTTHRYQPRPTSDLSLVVETLH